MRANMHTRAVPLAVAALLVLSLAAGCTSETKTVKRETVTYPVASTDGASVPSAEVAPGSAVQQQTTETTTETKKESEGVIGSGVHFIGNAIAFPFRVIGGAFAALF